MVTRQRSSVTLVREQAASTAEMPARAQPTRTVLVGAAALFILIAWLHLIVALEIASTGRQIQVANEQLDHIQRDNLAISHDIAAAEAQQNMAARAKVLGYGPQTPLYLPLALGERASDTPEPESGTGAGIASERQEARPLSPTGRFLLDATFEGWTTASWP